MGNTVPGEAGSADLGLESWLCQSLAGKLHQLSEPQFALLYDGDNNAFFLSFNMYSKIWNLYTFLLKISQDVHLC